MDAIVWAFVRKNEGCTAAPLHDTVKMKMGRVRIFPCLKAAKSHAPRTTAKSKTGDLVNAS